MSPVTEIKPPRRRDRGHERITTRNAIETWGRRALLDLYLALGEVEMISVIAHLYFLAQGLEKLGKAYLIATQTERFGHLPAKEGIRWIDQYARSYKHRLSDILGSVGIGLPSLRSWLRDPVIEILEGAMEEGRYPVPVEKSLSTTHGPEAVWTHRNREKALVIAKQLVEGINTAFGVDLMNGGKPPYGDIEAKDWTRFLNYSKLANKG